MKNQCYKPFYGDPWNGGKYESKKPFLIISYHEQRKAPYIKCFILYSNFRGKYLI